MKTKIISFSLWTILLSSLILGWTFSLPGLKDYDFLSIAIGGTNQLPPILVTGSLHMESYQPIFPKTSGVVSRVHIKPGDPVKKGQILLELDYEKRDLALYVKLRKIANQLGINEIVGGYLKKIESAKAEGILQDFRSSGLEGHFLSTVKDYIGLLKQITDLREQTEDRIVFAPFSGVISEVNVVVGERVDHQRSETPCVGILQSDAKSLHIKLELPEEVVSLVSIGDQVVAQIPLTDVSQVPAKVSSVASSITQTDTTRYFSATAEVDPEFDASRIRQGMKVFANINNSKRPDGIWVPRSAIDLEVPQFMISQTLNLTSLDSSPKELATGKERPKRQPASGQSPITTQLVTKAFPTDVRTANLYLLTVDEKIVKAVVPVGLISEDQVLVLSKAIDGAKVITHFSRKKKDMFRELNG